MTRPTRRVLGAMLTAHPQSVYGGELPQLAKVTPGSIYAILVRLEDAGWVRSFWEEPSKATAEGRPARKYFVLNEHALKPAAAAAQSGDSAWRTLVQAPAKPWGA